MRINRTHTFLVCLGILLSVFSKAQNKYSAEQIAEQMMGLKNTRGEKPSIIISKQFVDARTGLTHIYFYQSLNGLPIFNATGSIHLNAAGKAAVSDFRFIAQANSKITGTPVISAKNAMDAAAAFSNIQLHASIFAKNANVEHYEMQDPSSSAPIVAKAGFLEIDGNLHPVWDVQLYEDKSGSLWRHYIDRSTGTILQTNDEASHCNAWAIHNRTSHTERAFVFPDQTQPFHTPKHKSGNGTYRVLPRPTESPLKGNFALIETEATAEASPFGWHDTDGVAGAEWTITRGNNVWAKEDTLGKNFDNGFSPNGGEELIFDYPFNIMSKARPNLPAAITNLFYWNNIMHDVTYSYGFDEVSGNFQATNYTNQGTGGDEVYADSEDGSGTNNANFATYPDGQRPRMQMYVWPTTGSSKVLHVDAPSSISGYFNSPVSTFGAKITNIPLTGKLSYPKDGSNLHLGCTAFSDTTVRGTIFLIDRGTCGFSSKVQAAQNAGAIACIVVSTDNSPFAMSGAAPAITIPSVMISTTDGTALKNALNSGEVTITLVDSSISISTYEGEFDAGVVCHEYGHGISNRLIGGALNTSCLNNKEQAGEGWSDFFALVLTDRYGFTDARSNRGVGNFLIGEDTLGLGIRNYRYSRDMKVNPVTYATIKTSGYNEVHALGFVYCTMLYDMYLNLIDSFGFDPDIYHGKGGNNIALQLVVEGFKLMPCSPGFVDNRNAILAADSLLYGYKHRSILWRTFARRGLGYNASQGVSTSVTDGTANYDLPPDVLPLDVHETNGMEAFTMYPNPAHTEVTIQSAQTVEQVEVIDLSGRIVQKQMNLQGVQEARINLQNMQAGVYIIRCSGEKGSSVQKLIVE